MLDYFRNNVRYQPLDAVNLVFIGNKDVNALWGDVLQVLDQQGWHQGLESSLFLEAQGWLTTQDASRANFPLHIPGIPRTHLRLWKTATKVVGLAHKDGLFQAKSFDPARDTVANIFTQAGWQVNPGSEPIGTKIRDPANDGFATKIVKP